MTDYNTTANSKLDHLKHKIGQMLFVGFHSAVVNEDSDIVKYIQKYNLGGVIYFDYYAYLKSYDRNIKNPDQLKHLTKKLQEFAPTPLFIGADVEGGNVNRLKAKYGFNLQVPTYLEMGSRDDLQQTYLEALKISIILKSIGINTNFAPVMDLDIDSPIITKFERAFSDDPEKVYKHCAEVIRAHSENDVISVSKHFPGHGSTKGDTHEGFVDATDTWQEKELVPFQTGIDEKTLDCVIVAHLFNKHLDPENPATLSHKIITELLREKMGFKGVVVSDDIDMYALKHNYSLEEIVVKFINAGGDIILMGNNHDNDLSQIENVINIIVEKIEEGVIPAQRINESYQRIMQMKEKYIFSPEINA
ncbi:MAG TPA: glycoside hydrolase family 3 [Alphaproteobacteria bacterium]|nr:glycoside hydrolase family 3 [Alphaproteobacteria bacterium]